MQLVKDLQDMIWWLAPPLLILTQILHFSASSDRQSMTKFCTSKNGYPVPGNYSCKPEHGIKQYGAKQCCIPCDDPCRNPAFARVLSSDNPAADTGCFGNCTQCSSIQNPTRYYKDINKNRCSQCKPCALLGMITVKACTDTENAVCGTKNTVLHAGIHHSTKTTALHAGTHHSASTYVSVSTEPMPHTGEHSATIIMYIFICICGAMLVILVPVVSWMTFVKCKHVRGDLQEVIGESGPDSITNLIGERNETNSIYDEINESDNSNEDRAENEDKEPRYVNGQTTNGQMLGIDTNAPGNNSNSHTRASGHVDNNGPSTEVNCGDVQNLYHRIDRQEVNGASGETNNNGLGEVKTCEQFYTPCHNSNLTHNVTMQNNSPGESTQNVHIQDRLQNYEVDAHIYQNIHDHGTNDVIEMQPLSTLQKDAEQTANSTTRYLHNTTKHNNNRTRKSSSEAPNRRILHKLQRCMSEPTKTRRGHLAKMVQMRLSKGLTWWRDTKQQHRSDIIIPNLHSVSDQ